MKLWSSIFKKSDSFYTLIKKQGDLTVEGTNLLNKFMGIDKKVSDHAVLRHDLKIKIKKVEEEGDRARRELINELNKSFITPFDRQDIFTLSSIIDDILDYSLNTAKEMIEYDIYPNFYLKKMIEKLSRGTTHINYAVSKLSKNKQLVNNNIIAAKSIENEIEETYREALAELFANPDFHYIFKIREIYRHVSNSADRISEAADTIGNIIIKEM